MRQSWNRDRCDDPVDCSAGSRGSEERMPVNDRDDIDIPAMKLRLEQRREELLHLTEAGAGARRPVELDQTRVGRLSRMDALQSQAMSIETERRRQLELRRIDTALARIGGDEFGYCVNCGEPIAVKRLTLDPTTPNCIACASEDRA